MAEDPCPEAKAQEAEVASKNGIPAPEGQPDVDKMAAAEEAKALGNGHFKAGKFALAVVAYSDAIDAAEDLEEAKKLVTVSLTNRAFCHLKMENFGSAILDATRAIELDESYTKAWYRRGCAHLAMAKYKLANVDLTTLAKMTPQDRDVREKLTECRKLLQAEKFAKAIASEKTMPTSETVNIDTIEVTDDYKGPHYLRDALREDPAAFCKELCAYMKDQKVLHKKYAYMIVLDMIEMMKKQPTLVRIDVPAGTDFTVCGDVHGQYYDLMNIWSINGEPSEKNPYLFNGDFVDRGSFSIECILALFAYKLAYPQHMHLARGNHETKNMNKLYGFEGEVKAKYDETLYELFCEAFCALPLCHVINGEVFVVHGGLFSKNGVTLADIEKLDRFGEPPDEGLLPELLWSDPQGPIGRQPSKRGVGVAFGPDVTEDFLKTNKLSMVVRSHEMKEEGYEIEHKGKLVTVFSAPNYCDQMGNKGAFIRFKADDSKKLSPNYKSFAAVAHPPMRPMQYANPRLLGGMFGGMGGF